MIDVVLPCLDEAAALPWVLERIPYGYRPIVVDNGSTDGSPDIAAAYGALVVQEPQRGFGAACHAGLLAATADLVCFMDADASLDPGQLPLVTGPVAAGESDLVLGRRTERRPARPRATPDSTGEPAEDGVESGTAEAWPVPGKTGRAWPAHARVGNAVLAWRLRRGSGIPLHDLGPMRACRREALVGLGLADRRFGYPLEMVLRAAAAGWRVTEVEVDYLPRAGRSKVTGTVRGTLRAISDMRSVLAEHRG
jgi:glycosyltransferase involved in cell wall biosynthesis